MSNIYDVEEPITADDRPTRDTAPAKSSGINFARLAREMHGRMTPEQRARADAAEAERKALNAATKPIASHWAWTSWANRNPKSLSIVIDREEQRDIGIRIEQKADGEILRFAGGPTGYEAYTLDADFAKLIVQPDWRQPERFHICAGTPGSWATVSVATSDVVAFLDSERPLLMASARGLPVIQPDQIPLNRDALMATLEQAFSTKRDELGKAQLATANTFRHQGHYTAGQVDGLQWMLEMLPGTGDAEMRTLFGQQQARSSDIVNAPFPMDHEEGRAYLDGLQQVVTWGRMLMDASASAERVSGAHGKSGMSAFMAPEILGSAADAERMRPTLRLTQVWARTAEPRPGSPDLIVTATWGKDHDAVVDHTVPKMRAAEEASNGRSKSTRWTGVVFEAETGTRLDNELLQPLKALATSTNRSIMVALGDKPTTGIPGITVRPDGTMTINKAFIQDPTNRVRTADDVVPGYPVTTLAAMEQTLKGPARAERLDVTIVTQGKTPAYDRASYGQLPQDHQHKDRQASADNEDAGLQPRRMLDLTRNSPFNTPTRVDRVAFLNESSGRPEWTAPMAIDQAGVLANHIRNEFKNNPEYAIALAKLEPEVVVADSRAEAFVMAAAVDAVTAHRDQVIAVPTQMMQAFETDRSAQLYIGDPKEIQEAVVRQFDARMKDLSKTLKLPMQEEESGLTADGDVRTRRYETSTPASVSHPQARFDAVDLAILAEDATGGQHTVEFVREGLAIKAQLQGTDVSVPAQAALGTMLLRQPEGVIARASMDDVKRAAARPGQTVTIDLAVPSQEWGRQMQGLKRGAQR